MFIPDPGFGFFHPGSRVKKASVHGSGSAILNRQELSIFKPKNYYVYPDPISGFFLPGSRISDPGVKKALAPGSWSASLTQRQQKIVKRQQQKKLPNNWSLTYEKQKKDYCCYACVPQSPTWLSRSTSWPRNSNSRHTDSPDGKVVMTSIWKRRGKAVPVTVTLKLFW
jgi:hypothetical protein